MQGIFMLIMNKISGLPVAMESIKAQIKENPGKINQMALEKMQMDFKEHFIFLNQMEPYMQQLKVESIPLIQKKICGKI